MWGVCNDQTVPHLPWSVWCGVEEGGEHGESLLGSGCVSVSRVSLFLSSTQEQQAKHLHPNFLFVLLC